MKTFPFNRRTPRRSLPKRERAFELEQLASFPVTRVGAQPTPEEAHVIEPQGVSYASDLPRRGDVPAKSKASGCLWVPKRRRDE